MNKVSFISLFLSLFCVGLICALPPADSALFITGFASGIAVETNGNVTQCVIDANVTLSDFETGFKTIDEGLKRINIKEVEDGLKDLGAGTQEAGKALKVCGVDEVADDIIAIGAELAEGKILQVVGKGVIDILYNLKTVKGDIQNATAAWDDGNYELSGKFYGELVALILKDWK